LAEANIESMRRGFAAFSRHDWDACLAEIHPEIEWHLTFQLPDLPPDKKVFRGHDEVRMLFENLSGVWEELTLELLEVLHETDDGQILKVRFAGTGGGSGIEVDRTLFYVHDVRDGLLVRQRPYDTEQEAFDAAGVKR
jgi:ketosteroid isomerase-like protein